MVRMVHADHFYEISLQRSEPQIKFSTKTNFLEKMTMLMIPENARLCQEVKGILRSKTEVFKHIPYSIRAESQVKTYLSIQKMQKWKSKKLFSNRACLGCV